MSLAQILGHLRMGDVIIVRENDASLRLRLTALPGRAPVDANTFDSRKLLRRLIAARKDGGKK
jgi:hypothetical protein